MDRLPSAFSDLIHRLTSKSTGASTRDPDHQLRKKLLHYGLASLRKTFRELETKQSDRHHTLTGERYDFTGKTESLEILTEVIFDGCQEPSMSQWNLVIDQLLVSHRNYETHPPRDDREFGNEEEFQVFDASVKSDLELMRKIAEFDITSTSPAQQPSIDLSEVSGEVWERWKVAELDRASEEFKKAVEECKGVLGTVTSGQRESEANGRAALLTATHRETTKASTD